MALVGLGRLDNLDEVAELVRDRPVAAVGVMAAVGTRLHELTESLDPAELRSLVAQLTRRGDLAGGLFAVVLVRSGSASGWADPWRDLLLDLRRHPVTDVRDEAVAIDMSS